MLPHQERGLDLEGHLGDDAQGPQPDHRSGEGPGVALLESVTNVSRRVTISGRTPRSPGCRSSRGAVVAVLHAPRSMGQRGQVVEGKPLS